MLTFLTGLACGAVSGTLTFIQTGDTQVALIIGVLVAVLAWIVRGVVLITEGS